MADSGVIAEGKGLTIRRMRDELDDYALLLRWRSAPHVAEWSDTAPTEIGLDGVVAKYRPRTRADNPTTACIVVARDNIRAQRAYEKAGLVQVSEVLDTDTRAGQRIPSYLMALPPPP